MESQLEISKTNNTLEKRIISLKKQCWRNEQYSRRECVEIMGIPDSTDETKVSELIEMVTGINVMRCAIWYHLYSLKNVKNTHGGVSILVKLQAEACNFTKINTPLWVFFTFLKLYK